jgi:hypothetical protein
MQKVVALIPILLVGTRMAVVALSFFSITLVSFLKPLAQDLMA